MGEIKLKHTTGCKGTAAVHNNNNNVGLAVHGERSVVICRIFSHKHFEDLSFNAHEGNKISNLGRRLLLQTILSDVIEPGALVLKLWYSTVFIL